MFTVKREIAPDQISSTYNHVHHAKSLFMLEEARLRFLESIGYPLEGFLEQKLFLVITSIQVTYKRELVAGPIEVTCEKPRIEGRAVVLEQRILNQRGKVALEAVVESMFLSGETRRAVRPPEEFVAAFGVGRK